nr:MAG TPA: hypothetical protein [Inoviridae sp.]
MVKLIFCWNFARLSLHSGRLSLAKFFILSAYNCHIN